MPLPFKIINILDKTMDKFYKVEELDHTLMPDATREKFWNIWKTIQGDWQ